MHKQQKQDVNPVNSSRSGPPTGTNSADHPPTQAHGSEDSRLKCKLSAKWINNRHNSSTLPTSATLPPHHQNRFTALFLGPPTWAGARRKSLLDFMVLQSITKGRHKNNLDGHHSIRTNQQSTSINPPHFYAGCPSCRNPPNLSWFGTGTGICWIAYPHSLVQRLLPSKCNNRQQHTTQKHALPCEKSLWEVHHL